MWLTEGCGGRRRAVAIPNRESRKEKKCFIHCIVSPNHLIKISHLSSAYLLLFV